MPNIIGSDPNGTTGLCVRTYGEAQNPLRANPWPHAREAKKNFGMALAVHKRLVYVTTQAEFMTSVAIALSPIALD